MTLYNIYEAVLTEVNKDEASVILLEDFNYLYKKAIYQYCNLRYNNAEKDQQALDDINFLYAKKVITDINTPILDYMHSLGCVVKLSVVKAFKQYKVGDIITIPATRYRSDYDISRPFFTPSETRAYYRVLNNKVECFIGPEDLVTLKEFSINYLKQPTINELTDSDIENGGIGLPELPFGEYQTLEIINIISNILLENATDPRIQTFSPINKTIQ